MSLRLITHNACVRARWDRVDEFCVFALWLNAAHIPKHLVHGGVVLSLHTTVDTATSDISRIPSHHHREWRPRHGWAWDDEMPLKPLSQLQLSYGTSVASWSGRNDTLLGERREDSETETDRNIHKEIE